MFNLFAVTAAPAVNRIEDAQAKRLSLATMRVAIEHDPSSVRFILKEVLKLPTRKVDELRSLIERTPLLNLMSAMRMITGRLDFIAGLDALLFNRDYATEVLERSHLHELIERQPWIFGEEFATHASDQSLTTVLKKHIDILGRQDLVEAPVLDDEQRERRIDFMFGRSLEFNRQRREHLVVEIKRPSRKIGREELDQIENYAMTVARDSRFDLDTVEWDFVLMAVDWDDIVENRLGQHNRDPRLMHDKNGIRIWVRRWAEVLEECKHRLRFVQSRLEYDPTSDQAMQYLRNTYPDFVPDPLPNAFAKCPIS